MEELCSNIEKYPENYTFWFKKILSEKRKYFTGNVYEGGKWYTDKYDYLSLPLMVKENTILPMGARDDRPDYDYVEDIVECLLPRR